MYTQQDVTGMVSAQTVPLSKKTSAPPGFSTRATSATYVSMRSGSPRSCRKASNATTASMLSSACAAKPACHHFDLIAAAIFSRSATTTASGSHPVCRWSLRARTHRHLSSM